MSLRAPIARAPTAAPASALGWVAAASAIGHALALAALAWRPGAGDPAPERATIQIEYVSQAATAKGAPNAAKPAETAAEIPHRPPPLPPDPLAPPLPPESAPSPAAQPATPAVNLGNADADRDALTVTGDDVVSSGPDATYRNMPPNYPPEAVRRHQEGSVQVLIHVTPSGLAGEIETITSSGSDALDDAARNAVMNWHFVPALREGVPVASVYLLQMNFRSANHP